MNNQTIQKCKSALLVNPKQPAVWQSLGEAWLMLRRLPEAQTAYENALQLDGTMLTAYFGLAAVCKEQGNWHEASQHYRQGLKLEPENIEALVKFGVLLAEHGQTNEAIDQWRTVVRLNPEHAQAIHNLGVAFAQTGNPEESIRHLRQALELNPDYAEAHYNLGNVLNSDTAAFKDRAENLSETRDGRRKQAVEHYLAAIRIQPKYVEAYHNLGALLLDLQRPAEGAVWLRQAVRIIEASHRAASAGHQNGYAETPATTQTPHVDLAQTLLPSALNQLGLALAGAARYREAERCFHRALDVKFEMAEAHSNLGNLYQEQGRLPEALASYELAMALDPQSATTRWNRSLSILQSGDFARGWQEYEWRWQRKQTPARPFRQPRWDGGPLEGRTLLIYMEQGLGDMLQFVRYAKVAKERGGRVLVECPGFLAPLLARCPGVDEIVLEGVLARGAEGGAGDASRIPQFDVQIPLMSLPAVCRSTLETVPNGVPYVFVEGERVERWRLWVEQNVKMPRLTPPCKGGEGIREEKGESREEELRTTHDSRSTTHDQPFTIGIAWQGNPNHRLDRYRSVALREFARLAKVPGVRLVSLQKGPGAAQIGRLSGEFSVCEPPRSELMTAEALMDTAALMKRLDLVISVDTGTAHLAGALGVPVWVPLSAIGEWRWLIKREDSPWYPTMRLFRQKKLGEWKGVFRRMARELMGIVSERQATLADQKTTEFSN